MASLHSLTHTHLLLALLMWAQTHGQHVDDYPSGCSPSVGGDKRESNGEYLRAMDGDVMWYADYKNDRGVPTMPSFTDPFTFPSSYEVAVSNLQNCKANLAVAERAFGYPQFKLVAPDSMLFPHSEVRIGVPNTLLCHVSGFYPAPASVRWTRNAQNVSEGLSTSVSLPSPDLTFSLMASLSFIPQEGDRYDCIVEHPALKETLTRTYDVAVNQPAVAPAVFCAVGLTLGLLGVATGTFFLIKGTQCR